MSMRALLFDIGGTNMRFAITRDGRRFGKPLVVPTRKKFEGGMQAIAQAGRALAQGTRLTHVVGGVPGPLNASKNALLGCRNIPGWVGHNIAKRLHQLTGARVYLENDSALVALGEATAGAGAGYPVVAYVGIGTGIGGARVVDGRIDVHQGSFEPGHQLIDLRHPFVRWEGVASGSAVQRKTGQRPSTIHDRAFWKTLVTPTAFGVVNVALLWSPDIVVIGGSMTKRWGISISAVRQRVTALWPLRRTKPPRIVRGKLQNVGGLYGALALLRQTVKGGERDASV